MATTQQNTTFATKIQKAGKEQYFYRIVRNKRNIPVLSRTTTTIKDAVKEFANNSTLSYFVRTRVSGDVETVIAYLRSNGFTDVEIADTQKYILNATNTKSGAGKKLLESETATFEQYQSSLITRPLNSYQVFVKQNRKVAKKEAGKTGNVMAILKAKWDAIKDTPEAEKYEKRAEQLKTAHRREARKGLPKRPYSAYFLWSNANHEQIKKENPNKSIIELAKIKGQKWRVLTGAQRQPFVVEANRLKTEYQRAVNEYRKTHPEKKTTRRPTSAFFYYLDEQRNLLRQKNPSLKITEISRLAKTEWDKLTASQRQKYLIKGLEDKKRYSREKAGRPTSPLRSEELKTLQGEKGLVETIGKAVSPKATAAVASSSSNSGKKSPAKAIGGKKN